MQPHTKHIAIKYHHLRSFVANGDVEIKNVDTKEHIKDIFIKLLDPELLGYLRCKLNSWWVNVIIISEGVRDYAHEASILVLLYYNG